MGHARRRFCFGPRARTRAPGVERKRSAVVWHYREVDPEYGEFKANRVGAVGDDAEAPSPLFPSR